MATRNVVNNQVRGFAIIWTAITLLIGIAAFFAIYLTYEDDTANSLSQGVSIPRAETEPAGVAINATAVPTSVQPTSLPSATTPPTEESQDSTNSLAIAQAVQETQAEPTIQPTLLPVNNLAFDVGIQVQNTIDFSREVQNIWMNDVDQLGLHWIKQQIRWKELEPEQGQYDWSLLDFVLPIASERGIKVLISVLDAPDWARQPGVNLEEVGPPENPQDFADFLVAMVDRYPGMIHAIEVWNEMNIDRGWTSTAGLSAADYVALLRTVYVDVKDADPGVIIISGALSPTGGLVRDGVALAIDDFDFMDQLIRAGLLNYVDCVGAHHNGYNIGPSVQWDNVPPDNSATFRGPFDNPHHSWSFRSTLQTYANKIAVAGGDQRLCVTEFGWPVTEDLGGTPENFGFADDNTLEEQAEFTVEAINNMDEWNIVWLAMIWNLNYGPQSGWDPTSDNTPYSLIGPDWAKRPAFDAVAQWSANRPPQ
jgi:hypothetical protein